jgi:hypothetical protein
MTFPQRWDPETNTLEIRIAALPFTNPLAPIAPGQPAFADADLLLQAAIVPSLAHLPKSAEAIAPKPLGAIARPNRRALLERLAKEFHIVPAPPPPPRLPGSRAVKKYLPESYRAAFDFPGPRHQFVSTDRTYRCTFESATKPDPNFKPDNRMTWGEVLGYLLRNRHLAEQAGLLFGFDIHPDDSFASGGWLFASLQPASPYAGMPDVRMYAARIPALGNVQRPVFAAIQFPVDDPAVDEDANVFIEAEAYSDGFAKIVHGAQPIGSGSVDTEPGGPAPVRDRGIRLGWDDEQIATWLNRQIGLDPYTRGAPKLAAPISVLGYRVDVRRPGEADWSSLQEVEGAVKLDAANGFAELDLGEFRGELAIETIPLNLQGKFDGDHWLPAYFVSWMGGSVALTDPAALSIDNRADLVAAQRYKAVGMPPELRYGHAYEFRVRLMDLSSGGPRSDEHMQIPGDAPAALVHFRRFVPPKAPTVVPIDGAADGKAPTRFEITRPRLGFPDLMFALGPAVIPDLIAERDRVLSLPPDERAQGVGLPDPDAVLVRVTVAVRQLAMDETEYRDLYAVDLPFPADSTLPIQLDIEYHDVHDVAAIAAPNKGDPLPVPTARDVRLSFQTLGRDTADYFGSDEARLSVHKATTTLRADPADERGLFLPQTLSERIRAFYLQPDPPPTGFMKALLAMQGVREVESLAPPRRLADALGLECDELTMWAKPGHRTLFGASAAIAHQLGPDYAGIRFNCQSDLVLHWIIVLHLKLDRDWTWDALQLQAVRVFRDGNFVGMVNIPRVVNRHALQNAARGQIDLMFFDAIDPKPHPPAFPEEVETRYTVEPVFRATPLNPPETILPAMRLRLPITTPPVQTPQIVSTGIAFSPFAADERYSSTTQRRRMLWIEFDRPPDDKLDRYYCRVLANSPDPMLTGSPGPEVEDPPELPLPVSPELIRVIVPDQSADDCGLDAMQELVRSPDDATAVHYLVPLPDNMDESALELFGFFTYEFRLGHNAERWSTCQGRYGPPLRVTGVQHPTPPLVCQVSRARDRIEARAPFATPTLHRVPVRPLEPRTDMWILLYAQVLQADGKCWRNILLSKTRAERLGPQQNERPRPGTALEYANARFPQDSVDSALSTLGLSATSPLGVLAVEMIPETVLRDRGAAPLADPLGESLGEVRILRTSPLVPVPLAC